MVHRIGIRNLSPERLKLTQVRPGVLVAKNAYRKEPYPGESPGYFDTSPLFAPGGKLAKSEKK